MKNHSAWLAAGLLLFAVLACSTSTSTGPVTDLHMAKDNAGELGSETKTFSPSDRTVHCVATLKEAKEGTQVKFAWWAVDAEGSKNEKVKDLDYTTKAEENIVHGHLTLPRDWPKGKYKCEVSVNGTIEKTVEYKVE
jgi:hypothetical protein